MIWPLLLSAVLVTVPPTPQVEGPPPVDPRSPARQGGTDQGPIWQIGMRVMAPVTSTDPQHVAVGTSVERSGRYRIRGQYQPSETRLLGAISASMGWRLLRLSSMDVAFDLDYTQVWADRRLFRGTGWQLEGHDRRRLSLGIVTLLPRNRRLFGLIDSVEVGAGRMYIRRLVSARAGAVDLNPTDEPILVSSGPVGMIGVHAVRPLFWGLNGNLHARVIGAGRSRGGEVPFAQLVTEWDVTRRVFQSQRFGRGELGLAGTHATSIRSVSYFQNGIGLTFRISY